MLEVSQYPTSTYIIKRAIAIKTEWYWHKNSHKSQRNRLEDPDMNPYNYAHLIFAKDVVGKSAYLSAET
jgi:hypothetical protein